MFFILADMNAFVGLDWMVVALYGVLLAGTGWWLSRGGTDSDGYFRGSGNIPSWAAAISLWVRHCRQQHLSVRRNMPTLKILLFF